MFADTNVETDTLKTREAVCAGVYEFGSVFLCIEKIRYKFVS